MAGFLSKLTGIDNDKEEENLNSDIEYFSDDVFTPDENEISLSVDAFEDSDNIFIQTFIPGIDPKKLEIYVSRDTVSITGERYPKEDSETDFFKKELSWGKFHKEILLPKEVNIENIKKTIDLGILTLKLSKIDKDRKIKVSID